MLPVVGAQIDAREQRPVRRDGRPSTQVVLIKSFDQQGIGWYIASRKARELDTNAFAAASR